MIAIRVSPTCKRKFEARVVFDDFDDDCDYSEAGLE